jgi:iron(III) transport system permease protein
VERHLEGEVQNRIQIEEALFERGKMAEAGALSVPRSSLWERLKNFVNAELINIFAAVLFLLLALFLLYPILAVLIKSVKGPQGLTVSYFIKFFAKGYYFKSLTNTLWLGFINTVVCLVVGFCLAYLTTRGPLHLRRPFKMLSLLPLIAPPYLFAISLIILFGHNGILTKAFGVKWSLYGFWGVVVAQTLAFIPLAYLMIENTLMSLNPNLEESAYDLGASEIRIIRTITIPLLAP